MFELKVTATTLEELKDKVEGIYKQFTNVKEVDHVKEFYGSENYNIVRHPPVIGEPFAAPKEVEEKINPPVDLSRLAEQVLDAHHADLSTEETVTKEKTTPDVDSRGLPWDARIHSSSKDIVGKGVWKKRRNVDAKVVLEVEAELLEKMKSDSVEETPVAHVPETPAAPVVEATQTTTVPDTPAVPHVPDVPLTGSKDIPVIDRYTMTKELFVKSLPVVFNHLLIDGKIDNEYIENLKAHYGVSDIWDIAKNETKAVEVYESLVSIGLLKREV